MENALSLSQMASGRRPSRIAQFQPPMEYLLMLKLKPKTRPPPSLASGAPTGDLPGTDHLAFPMASIDEKKDAYSVWGLPPPDVSERIKKLMEGIRSEFGGPRFEPHVTVVGDIRLTESEARDKFRQACEGLQPYGAAVSKVATGPSFYQCVFLLLHPTPEVVEASDHCCRHFGYVRPSAYMPHLSLLYADITDEEKKRVEERVYALDETIGNLEFPIARVALYKSDTQDKSLKSWAKVDEFVLHQIS